MRSDFFCFIQASSSRPKPTPPSQSNRPTIETVSNDDENADSNALSPAIVAADFSSFAFSANSNSTSSAATDSNANASDPASQPQTEARAKGPNPALRKGPNPDLLL